ncbi:MAG: carotenoid cleavage dioxygenase [Candidatus Binatia bacterium]|nr:MAG: carotenoid cleavage dioxygenase [Candidatus Binatia bacterium]
MTAQNSSGGSPFLAGNFAPWRREEDWGDLIVRGELPRELEGTYYRNGPNPAFDPLGRYHWFDGDGMIHAIHLSQGRATYRNRWVRSQGLEEEFRAGRALYYGLLDFGKGDGRFKNTANTNVVFHAGRLLALMEGALPTEVDAAGLETLGEFDFAGRLQGPMTAHPKVDPDTGELFFFGYSPVAPFLTFYRADRNGELVAAEPLPGGLPAMVHDFAITEHYAVFFVCPLLFRLENVGTERPVFSWEPECGTLWGVVPRYGSGQEVRWFEGEACFIFHCMNAFEDGGAVIVDVARYPEMKFLEPAQPGGTAHDFSQQPATLWRYRVDPAGGRVHGEERFDAICEFPRIDERRTGRPYRYGFAVARNSSASAPSGMPKFNGLAKFDWYRGTMQVRDFGSHAGLGEAVFVPSENAEEGQGYLMALVYDETRDRSEFHIVSAEDFLGDPVAVVELPHRIPYGFHGTWVARS